MDYIITTLIGLIGGAACAFVALQKKFRDVAEQKRRQSALEKKLETGLSNVNARQGELIEAQSKFHADQAQFEAKVISHKELQDEIFKVRQRQFDELISQFQAERAQFDAQVISHKELQDENGILKRDLRNLDVRLRKTDLDVQLQTEAQETLDQRAHELGSRYLKESRKWIGSSLNPNNYVACKQRLQDVIERCRSIGLDIPTVEEAQLLNELKHDYEKVVRAALERKEQARIRARIREEQMREREIQRELEQAQRERAAIQAALAQALAEAHDQHSDEVDRLQARLAEAEARSQRTISQAQLTKAGHVYVISNIGSLGEGVFKVGMTRRLEPLDRICELGDASVPFPFDVHMMISSNDAPSLEFALHRQLHKSRINKVNPRREFFRTDVEAIYQIVEQHHGAVEYVADAEALQYRQSLTMSDDDEEFIERVYDEADNDGAAADEDPVEECPTQTGVAT